MLTDLTLIESKEGYNLYKTPSHLLNHDGTPVFGWGNGYVSVPKTHPYYGKHWEDLSHIDVHGYVTYTDYLDQTNQQWLIGFDCQHGMDTLENCPKSYVEEQVRKLYTILKESENA